MIKRLIAFICEDVTNTPSYPLDAMYKRRGEPVYFGGCVGRL